MSNRNHLKFLTLVRLSLLTGLGFVVACGATKTDDNTQIKSDGGKLDSSIPKDSGIEDSGLQDSGTKDAGSPKNLILSCSNPTQLGNGIELCEEGVKRRTQATSCEDKRSTYIIPEDCADIACSGELDYCVTYHQPSFPGTHSPSQSKCTTGCLSDSDCASDHICECGDPIGRCVPASCKTNSDCSPEQNCLLNSKLRALDIYACTSPEQPCFVNSDCKSDEPLPLYASLQCIYHDNDTTSCKLIQGPAD